MRISYEVLSLLFMCSAASTKEGSEKAFLSVKLNDDQLILVKGIPSGAIAWASFSDATMKDGWAYLDIHITKGTPDHIGAYAAGVLEAALTRNLMENQFNNVYKDYCDNNEDYCNILHVYIQQQIDYLYSISVVNRNSSSFWHHVYLMLQQLTGLDDQFEGRALNYTNVYAYKKGAPSMYFNWEGDIVDLETAFLKKNDKHSLDQVGRCSALIKITQDDVFIGHTSWFVYKAMIRIQKRYEFHYHQQNSKGSQMVAGHTITMTSFPGKVVSLDDFYLISSGLAVTETTYGIYNDTLWKALSPASVPTWIRAMVANRLATTPKEWASLFQQENSGTYNNQWMIFNYNQVQITSGGVKLSPGAFWVVEQIPGYSISADLTKYLVEKGYWASYNIPYFKITFQSTNFIHLTKLFGNAFDHDENPRAIIFRRDQAKIQNIFQMLKMMRYNDYMNDPVSRCNCSPPQNPVYAIASRFDLLDPKGKYNVKGIERKYAGAIDAKVTNVGRFKKLQFIAVQGPTHDQQPVFVWSETVEKVPPGHPDVFDFEAVEHEWSPAVENNAWNWWWKWF